MKDMGAVYGSAAQAVPLVVGKDTVYVHTDIQEALDAEGNPAWQYNEVQYGKDEYIRMMAERNDETEEILDTLLGAASDG
jgi:hypothetical protein